MWEPQSLTTLWASMACYRDSFTLLRRAMTIFELVFSLMYQSTKPYKSSEINSTAMTHWGNGLSCRSKPSWNCWRFAWESQFLRWKTSYSNKKMAWLREARHGPLLVTSSWNILRNWLRLALSKGPNWVGVFPPTPVDGNRCSFRKVAFSNS
jgi:hypothetical protein